VRPEVRSVVVDLLDVGALKESLWGFNGFFSKKNGGGFLTDHFPLAQKSIWGIRGLYTSSRHIPGVNFAGLIHPGLIDRAALLLYAGGKPQGARDQRTKPQRAEDRR